MTLPPLRVAARQQRTFWRGKDNAAAIIDARGRLLLTLPQAEAGLAVVDRGAATFHWRGAVSAATQGAAPESTR
jgi:hypothetical protein